MTHRSTRNKIRWQAGKAIDGCDRIQEHWQALDELSGGQSEHISETLPLLVLSLEEYKKACIKFREGL